MEVSGVVHNDPYKCDAPQLNLHTMKHPLLRNPAKWLNGVEKGHSTHLYLNRFYDAQLLAANPFANALVSTRKDVSNARFPLGTMTQIVVQKTGEQEYQLVPVIEKPKAGLNPASYVIANARYIDFVSKRHFKPIPLKYRHRSPAMANTIGVVDDFVGKVQSMLLGRVQTLWDEAQDQLQGGSEPDSTLPLVAGIVVVPSSTVSGWWENGTYYIGAPFCSKDTKVPYVSHVQLCGALTKYVRFSSVTSTRTPATQPSLP